MSGLLDHIALLNLIESYHSAAESTVVKGLDVLDVSETKGKIHVRFDLPDRHFPDYSFSVEFRVTRCFFDKHLRRMLKIEL